MRILKFASLTVLILTLLILPLLETAGAETPSQVALIPLTIYASGDISQIRKTIQQTLARKLAQEGLVLVAGNKIEIYMAEHGISPTRVNDYIAEQIGKDIGTRYVTYGTVTQAGENITLELRLIDTEGEIEPGEIRAEGKGLKNLILLADRAASGITSKIFHRQRIAKILIRGNHRIEEAAIKLVIQSAPGDIYNPNRLRQDMKAIYKMGYFDDVQIEAYDSPEGKVVTFVVHEKPTIVQVNIKGAKNIDEEDIRSAISTKKFTILREKLIKEDEQKIKELYREKGFFKAKVKSQITKVGENKVAVTFNIKENKKLYVHKITFTGNKHFSDSKLRKLMQTSERNIFLAWFTHSGVLKKDLLDVDLDRLAVFYHDHGFIHAKIGTPKISYDDKGIVINIPIVEGPRYKIGKVSLEGDLIDKPEKLLMLTRLPRKKYLNREELQKDIQRLTEFYQDHGYANVDIEPRILENKKEPIADVVYNISKRERVYIQRINISGNTKTRDKVIRRELAISEGDMYRTSLLKRSSYNLKRLDYFDKVELETSKGTANNLMQLNVKVKEKPTGAISFGAGYSSEESIFAVGQIYQRNFLGKGQKLALQAQLGKETQRYSISFTEPWLMDTHLSLGLDAFNLEYDYDDYTKDSFGGNLRLSYPFGDWSRIYFTYSYEDADITDVDYNAALVIKDQEGRHTKSSVTFAAERDTRDHPFLATQGSDNRISIEYAGKALGGDSDFIKYIFNSGWYIPLFWKTVGFIHFKGGYISGSRENVPLYERFYLGGINSIRGFEYGDVGPKDPKTGDSIGGNKFGQVNLEFLFPLLEKMGVRGVIFFDAGNAFDNDEDFDISKFRTSAGGGIRWHSPMGPLRLEWGYNLDKRDDEDQSKWEFSMGLFF